MQVFRGNLSQNISINTKVLYLPDLLLEPKIRTTSSNDAISISINLISESTANLENYLKNWSLDVSGIDSITLKIIANTSAASNSCSKSLANGVYTELKGVCFESLEVIVPQEMKPVLSSDNKMITFESENVSSDLPGKRISRESADFLIASLSSAFFDNEKVKLLQNFVSFQSSLGANEILISDVVRILKTINFDNSKIQSVRILSSFIKNRIEAYRTLELIFAFQSHKEELRAILLP